LASNKYGRSMDMPTNNMPCMQKLPRWRIFAFNQVCVDRAALQFAGSCTLVYIPRPCLKMRTICLVSTSRRTLFSYELLTPYLSSRSGGQAFNLSWWKRFGVEESSPRLPSLGSLGLCRTAVQSVPNAPPWSLLSLTFPAARPIPDPQVPALMPR
jgi:hypothetical protein